MKNPATITSRESSWFQRFRKAIERHDEELVLEGPKQIEDAIKRGWSPIAEAFDEALDEVGRSGITFSTSLFRSLSDTRHSQGRLALFQRPRFTLTDLADANAPFVALDGVQDPGNVGTVIRTAAAFEAAGVICLEGCADPYSPKSLRASVGTVLQIPVVTASVDALLHYAEDHALPLYATSGRGSTASLPEQRSIIIFGSEGQGVRAELARTSQLFRITTSPLVESLNIAAAAAIVLSRMYETRGTR
ncbi:MAG TPA: RNA methyltransferase [Thermoanaerobaculia bacterium]|nr:RNA methyltransferase [Thermoanaerobaculia bacterium]